MPMPGGFNFGSQDEDEVVGGADDSGNGAGSSAGGSAEEQERIRRLTTATEDQTRARILAEIMKDPDLVAVMRARQAGKKVRVVEDQEDGSPSQGQQSSSGTPADDDLDEEKLENMSKKQLMGLILSSVSKQLDGIFVKKTKSLEDRLGNLESTATEFTQEQTRERVQQTAKKYPDFWNFKQKMMELSQQHPTLDAEELYVMAKAKAGQFVPKQNRVSLERPSSSSARPPKMKQDNHTAQAINDLARQSLRGYFEANAENAHISDEDARAYGG